MMENTEQFVRWFRSVAPYIHAFRGKTFVVAFPGELVQSGALPVLAHDLSLLHALGIRIVIVHGSRPQVEEQLALRNIECRYFNSIRITDADALQCVKDAAGEIRLDIEAAFSQGLPNTPMAHATMRIISGNFVTASPLGILEGVDMELTGRARRTDHKTIESILDAGALILLSPLGFAQTGEAFNLSMEDVATSAATALNAEKLIFITENPMIKDASGKEIRELSSHQAEAVLSTDFLSPSATYYLRSAVKASRAGTPRTHILSSSIDGSVLQELFTHKGVGTMVTYEPLESLRIAKVDDVGGILKLLEPFEASGVMVKRGRELIEREVDRFSVIDHDGVILGCAALYPFPEEKMAEMACLIVRPEGQGEGNGERILAHMEARAREAGFTKLFILTTQTEHWFLKQGFVYASIDELPENKQAMYNWQRKSRVLIKNL